MTMTSRAGIYGLVLGAVLMIGAEARAVTVTFITSGRFTDGEAAGTSTYLLNGGDAANRIQIDFTTPGGIGGQTATVPPAANVSFGLFDTSATTATSFQNVSSGFELDIIELSPTFGGTATFVGTLAGRLFATGSQAYVQFDPSDLLRTIGLVSYEIVSADDGVLGRVNIPLASSNPSAINGRVNAIPEPSTVLLMGLGALAPLGLTLRRRMKRQPA